MAAADPGPVAPRRVEAMAKAPQQSRRVLVIDDIADLRFLLRAHLERRGFDVVAEAADPDVGQALAEEHHPDGVIIDMTMPGFDVLAAIGRLRATLPNASILAASATPADIGTEGLACAAGADGYFDKAAGFDDLVRQFASLFHLRRPDPDAAVSIPVGEE